MRGVSHVSGERKSTRVTSNSTVGAQSANLIGNGALRRRKALLYDEAHKRAQVERVRTIQGAIQGEWGGPNTQELKGFALYKVLYHRKGAHYTGRYTEWVVQSLRTLCMRCQRAYLNDGAHKRTIP